MVAVAHGGHRHVGHAGALDRLRHREGAGDLAHAVVPVDHQGRARVLDHARAAARIDAAPRQLAGVKRDTHHTVRMDPAQIGLDQLIGDDPGVGFRHGATLEDRAHDAKQRLVCEPPLALDSGILGHRSSLRARRDCGSRKSGGSMAAREASAFDLMGERILITGAVGGSRDDGRARVRLAGRGTAPGGSARDRAARAAAPPARRTGRRLWSATSPAGPRWRGSRRRTTRLTRSCWWRGSAPGRLAGAAPRTR